MGEDGPKPPLLSKQGRATPGVRSVAATHQGKGVAPKGVIRATASPDFEVGTMLEAKNRWVMLAEFLRGHSPAARDRYGAILVLFLAPQALLRGHTYCAGALTSDAL